MVLFAAIRGGKQWAEALLTQRTDAPEVWTEVIRVTLSGGDALAIDPASAPRIREETRAWLQQQAQQIQDPLAQAIAQQTEAIYQATAHQVPAFADWYFSLGGEYSRLFQAALGNLPEFVAGRLQELVFEPAATAEAVERMAEQFNLRWGEQFQGTVSGLQDLLARLVRKEALPAEEGRVRITGEWHLGDQVSEHLGPYLTVSAGDLGRQGVATTAGAGLAAVTAKKLGAMTVAKASAKLAAGESVGALAAGVSKLGIKTAAKAGALGGVGAGATSGAALCATTVVGAPLAPGCALVGGVVTGVATWLLVDKAVLEAEELLGREAFEEELRGALAAQRDELRDTLNAHYRQATDEAIDRLVQDLDGYLRPVPAPPAKTFVPARAVEQATTAPAAPRPVP
jgi:hypothetical protein